jgi:FlaA1/EpsC-like NDP-sugar epimerase
MVHINRRSLLAFIHDVLAAAAAWLLAFWLRFNLELPPQPYLRLIWQAMAYVVPLQAVLFLAFGLYRGLWRYASLPDLKRILLAVATSTMLVPALLFMLRLGDAVPRSTFILDPLLLAILMGGSRLAYRAWKEHRFSISDMAREPVFVVGAGEATVNLIKELAHSHEWRVVGVFDDDATKQGMRLQGVSILGGLDALPQWRDRLEVQRAIIALPHATHQQRRRVIEHCTRIGLTVMTVPSLDDLVSGRVTVSQIRHVELDDLLGRDPVVLDTNGIRDWIRGRTVMVTGAGGSIGSELCRQIARFEPGLLVLFELNEFALYCIEQEFAEQFPGVAVARVIGDVKDEARVAQVLRSHAPSAVFHAAAYKHVPLMENDNAWEAVRNNVAGTHVLAQAAIRQGVEKFVLISTDKAVNPTNVMGATKRLAEMLCETLQPSAVNTRFVMVRFGNVLGSTGSVIPKFREQIARGGPVTVTHPEITRYFMSIPEAAQLVLQAGLMGRGGEIFVLDMGEPIKIDDLARDMIRLSGFRDTDIRIVYTGLRPGEKLYEELLADGEQTLPTPHAKLRVARARHENGDWLNGLVTWLGAPTVRNDDAVKQALMQWVPEYRPADNGRAVHANVVELHPGEKKRAS